MKLEIKKNISPIFFASDRYETTTKVDTHGRAQKKIRRSGEE